VAKVAAAFGAENFGAGHAELAIGLDFDRVFTDRFVKAGPAAAGFVFSVGTESGLPQPAQR